MENNGWFVLVVLLIGLLLGIIIGQILGDVQSRQGLMCMQLLNDSEHCAEIIGVEVVK